MANIYNIIEQNYITFLAQILKENGCKTEIRTAENIFENLFYLSKEDGHGSRYIPLQYKRQLEKLLLGMTNSSLEFKDGEDVYFETQNGITVCNANVFWVQHLENGEKKILGHGFNSLSLMEVLPNSFISDNERVSKWKATTIGGAKSRALYEGGLGLEFYGDVFLPEVNLDEAETEADDGKKSDAKETAKSKDSKKVEEPELSALGLPVPKPKRGPKPKAEKPTEEEPGNKAADIETPEAAKESEDINISIATAKSIIADVGNYKGISLGKIYESFPKNLVFLSRNSQSENVRKGAEAIIRSDKELSEKYL